MVNINLSVWGSSFMRSVGNMFSKEALPGTCCLIGIVSLATGIAVRKSDEASFDKKLTAYTRVVTKEEARIDALSKESEAYSERMDYLAFLVQKASGGRNI